MAGVLLSPSFLFSSCTKEDDDVPMADVVQFEEVVLNGSKEVPANNSEATGTFAGTYDKNTNILSYTVTYEGIDPTAMHFHLGEIRVSGGVEVPIGEAPYSSPVSGDTPPLTQTQEDDLLAGRWYVNIHSSQFPAGEIRGQVTNDLVEFSNVILNAAEEVPTNPSTATGVFNGTYNKETMVITYSVTYSGIEPTAMHFHLGAPGVNGGVVIGIGEAPYSSPVESSTRPLTAEEETNLLAGNWYVNVHSEQFPAGEIRGQVTE